MATDLNTQALALAQRFQSLAQEIDTLSEIVCNPQCGKPGRGYKAAHKAAKRLIELEPQYTGVSKAIEDWVSRKRKASQAERDRRFAAYARALGALSA